MRILIAIVILSLTVGLLSAAVPEWVKNFDVSQKYPPKLYLAAISVATGNIAEASKIASANAQSEVSRMIIVNIKGMLSSMTEESNNKYSQYLSSISQSYTSIQLMGLKVDLYPDDDKKAPKVYAVAYASKADLRSIYTKKKDELINKIAKITSDALSDESSDKPLDAVKKYLSLMPLYEELKEAETILLVIGASSSIESAFEELDREVGHSVNQTAIMSQTEVSNKIEQLLSQSNKSVGDVARALALRLSQQAGETSKQVWVSNFTYRDTGMSGTFARYFQRELESSMAQIANWNVPVRSRATPVRQDSLQSMRDLAREAGAQWYIYGTYWDSDGKIKVVATMRDVATNKVLGSADVTFSSDILTQDMQLRPANYESALIAQQAFEEGQILSSYLQLDLWTNKGNENVSYVAGETMKVYLRVNREAYVRLLYLLADGRWTLLYDNYYVDRSKVNQIVELPMEFECSPPFGAEMLVAIARTEKFSPLTTIMEDGYEFLRKDPELPPTISTRNLVSDVRGDKGFKPKTGESLEVANTNIFSDLDKGKIPETLLKEFQDNNFELSLNAMVSVVVPNSEWLITDLNSVQTYLVRREDKIRIYKIQQTEKKVMITTMES